MQNRRLFLKQVSLASVSLLVPSMFAVNPNLFLEEILIGKKKPILYGKNYRLLKPAYLAFEEMKKAALLKGVTINVMSSYRDFHHQNRLWTTKYEKFRALGYSVEKAVNKTKEYTAIPAASRHHWGTDVDLIDANKKQKGLQNYDASKFNNWMDANAHKFGFYRVYTKNKFRKGYKYESWHYSFRDLSKPMLEAYLQLDLNVILKNKQVAGHQIFTPDFIQTYIEEHVLGINDYLF
jgi:LAS superfamily LD-carboxypeptidase LdcB